MNSKLHKNKQSQTFLFKKNKIGFFFFCCIVLFTACSEEAPTTKITQLPTKFSDGIQAVIEIPAGTNRLIAFDANKKSFEAIFVAEKEAKINFLPYIGNYGFIASSLKKPTLESSRNALDVLVISEYLPTGTLLKVQPIGTLQIMEKDKLISTVISIPVDTSLQTIPIANFKEFLIRHHVAKRMIEDWFLTYKGVHQAQLIGWQDERQTTALIEQWSVK
jgi:inorganic pyrophosphatase